MSASVTTPTSKRKRAPNKPTVSLVTRAKRERLAPDREPYWNHLGVGTSLGFRRGPDTWIARFLDRAGKYHFNAMGQFAGAKDEYTAAKDAAEKWFAQMSGGARRTAKRGTVAEALQAYIDHLRDGGRVDAADDAFKKLRACVFGNLQPKRGKVVQRRKLADELLEECTKEDFLGWRKELQQGRNNRTINRYVTSVAAGLNCATKDLGFVGNAEAWTLTDLQEDDADGDSAVYLTIAQRERLTSFLVDWMKPFAKLLYVSGARPNEIAQAIVADYDPRHHTITLRWKKGKPAKVRARLVTLDPKDAAEFKAAIKDKLPTAPLVMTPNGQKVPRHRWAKEMRSAIKYANGSAKKGEAIIPDDASAYSYRHTRISDLLQVYGVDALTVANQTGTSLAMMERYYWKFLPNAMREKFSAERK